ncbi:MAG: tetratricopeptide repeat protein [Pseudomonadota bacterium]
MTQRLTLLRPIGAALCLSAASAQAQYAVEDADDHGVLNPVDYSERHYMDLLQRFPERAGTTCYGAYILDKTDSYNDTLEFFKACAERGSPGAMVYLSHLYEMGLGTAPNPEEATRWVREAAERGYAVGQYHYGLALLDGRGVDRDDEAGRKWLSRAAAQGDSDAEAELTRRGLR